MYDERPDDFDEPLMSLIDAHAHGKENNYYHMFLSWMDTDNPPPYNVLFTWTFVTEEEYKLGKIEQWLNISSHITESIPLYGN
jgi:hypothetical protein